MNNDATLIEWTGCHSLLRLGRIVPLYIETGRLSHDYDEHFKCTVHVIVEIIINIIFEGWEPKVRTCDQKLSGLEAVDSTITLVYCYLKNWS